MAVTITDLMDIQASCANSIAGLGMERKVSGFEETQGGRHADTGKQESTK